MPIPQSPWRRKRNRRQGKKDKRIQRKKKIEEGSYSPEIDEDQTEAERIELVPVHHEEKPVIEEEQIHPPLSPSVQPGHSDLAPSDRGDKHPQSVLYGLQCPACGSTSIAKVTVYENQQKTPAPGCITCLLLIIIFILAPVLIVGPLALATALGIAALALYWPYIVGALAFILIIKIISATVKSKQYICLQCGKKFRP